MIPHYRHTNLLLLRKEDSIAATVSLYIKGVSSRKMSLNQIEPKWTNRQSLKNTKCYVFTWKIRLKCLYLQCCSKQAADMLRKQPCLVRTENLDNSLYTRTKTEVVHPIVYYCIHSASAGWVSTYTHWCELIFILCVQVVQNLQNRMKLVRTFFVPKNEITNK